MVYKDFQTKKLSALGLGAMRLPLTAGGSDAEIDETKTAYPFRACGLSARAC